MVTPTNLPAGILMLMVVAVMDLDEPNSDLDVPTDTTVCWYLLQSYR